MYLRHPLFESLGVPHGFGTVSSEMPEQTATAQQVHGVQVLKTKKESSDEKPEADGLWTDAGGMAVGVWTADCLPVLLATDRGRVVSAIHAGWRGAVSGVVLEGIDRLKTEAGNSPEDIVVVLGPSAGRCCYRVGPEVWDEIAFRYPGFFGRQSPPSHLDLPGLVLHQLQKAGVRPENTGFLDLCTICHQELFFSHRRQGKDRSGRSMINWIRASS